MVFAVLKLIILDGSVLVYFLAASCFSTWSSLAAMTSGTLQPIAFTPARAR